MRSSQHSTNQTKITSYRIKRIFWNSFLTLFLIVTLSGFTATAQKTNEWPCFHGTDRTNKSTETGLIKVWPKDGPELLWTASGLGEGYSSVSIGGGIIYTAGLYNAQTYVFCFDLNGKPLWKKPNGKTWTTTLSYASSYTGSRSTPTYDNGILYHLGERGRLAAFDSKTGEEIWFRELALEFDVELPEYGSGSNSRGWFCLNFLTGKQAWKTDGKGSVTYADGMLYMLDERGTMKLVRATPDKHELSGEFKVPGGGEGMYWAHPVVCGGRLYVRHADKLYAYNVRGK